MRILPLLSIVLVPAASAEPLHTLPPAEVSAWLESLEDASFGDRVLRITHASVGTPYFDGPLGEGPGAPYDDDPLIDLSRADCVTFVEQTIALAIADDYDDAVARLQGIRYADGAIGFATRNHFLVADWQPNNASWCRDVTATLGVATESLTRTIDKAAWFPKVGAPDLGQDLSAEPITISYVPNDRVADAEARIPDTAIVVFLGRRPDWLFALHCGFYLRAPDGEGALYHASSKAGAAIRMPLTDYVDEQAERYLGIAVWEVETPA